MPRMKLSSSPSRSLSKTSTSQVRIQLFLLVLCQAESSVSQVKQVEFHSCEQRGVAHLNLGDHRFAVRLISVLRSKLVFVVLFFSGLT